MKQVFRLQITMNDSFLMCRRQPANYLLSVLGYLAERYRAFIELLTEFSAFEQFGDDERRAVVFADVVNGEDVWVI